MFSPWLLSKLVRSLEILIWDMELNQVVGLPPGAKKLALEKLQEAIKILEAKYD